MADYQFNVKIVGEEDFVKFFKEMPDRIGREMADALNLSANQLRDNSAKNAPYGVTGNLKGSLHVEHATPIKLEARVGTDIVYGRPVEYGTRPHFPPIRALKLWARKKLGNENLAYAVARKIALRGTRPKYYMRDATVDLKSIIDSYLQRMVDRLVKHYPFT